MKTWVLGVVSALLIASVAGLAIYALQLRSQLNAANSDRSAARAETASLTLQLEQCQEAVNLGKELYGELNGAHAELILLYNIEHRSAVGNAQEQYGAWRSAEDRISISRGKSERFFELADQCPTF